MTDRRTFLKHSGVAALAATAPKITTKRMTVS